MASPEPRRSGRRPGPLRRGLRALCLGLAACLVPAVCAPSVPAQTWFDALVAQVDGQPILASDLAIDDALFGQGRPYAAMDAETRQAILDRLIARRLLLAEAERFGVAEPSAAAVDEAAAALRKRLGGIPAGIGPATFRERVRDRLWADAFVDARIRAFVFIRDAQVEQALESLPAPADEAGRAALEARVRRDLAAAEAKRRLTSYLARLEGRATIRRYLEPRPAAPPGGFAPAG